MSIRTVLGSSTRYRRNWSSPVDCKPWNHFDHRIKAVVNHGEEEEGERGEG